MGGGKQGTHRTITHTRSRVPGPRGQVLHGGRSVLRVEPQRIPLQEELREQDEEMRGAWGLPRCLREQAATSSPVGHGGHPQPTLRSSVSSNRGDSSLCPSSRLYATSRCRRLLSCSRPGAETKNEEGHVGASRHGGACARGGGCGKTKRNNSALPASEASQGSRSCTPFHLCPVLTTQALELIAS